MAGRYGLAVFNTGAAVVGARPRHAGRLARTARVRRRLIEHGDAVDAVLAFGAQGVALPFGRLQQAWQFRRGVGAR